MNRENPHTLAELTQRLRDFAAARDWEQFHTPKNLTTALIVEAAELVEHFQWLTPEESRNLPPETRQAVELEMADVLLYLLRLADALGVDLESAARRKLEINERKYPPEKFRGSARKSDES